MQDLAISKDTAPKNRQCGVRIGPSDTIEIKIGEDTFSFASADALTLANLIKKMVRQVTGLTRRKKKV